MAKAGQQELVEITQHKTGMEAPYTTPTGCEDCHPQQPVTDIQHWHR